MQQWPSLTMMAKLGLRSDAHSDLPIKLEHRPVERVALQDSPIEESFWCRMEAAVVLGKENPWELRKGLLNICKGE